MPVHTGNVLLPRSSPIIINSNFDIFERVGASAQTSTTTYNKLTSFAADRFFVLPAGASLTQQRSTLVPDTKSRFSLSVIGAASVTTVDIGQRIRATTVITQCKKLLRFSCWIFNDTGGAFTPNLRIGTPGSTDNFGTVTNRLDQVLQSCPAGSWTLVTHTFDPSGYTGINSGLEVALRIPSGSLTSGKTVYISQFRLDDSPLLHEFIAPDVQLEFLRGLEFYEVMAVDSTSDPFANGKAYAATKATVILRFMRKRTSVTVSFSDPTHFVFTDAAGTPLACSAVSAITSSRDSAWLDATCATGLVAGYSTDFLSANSSAKIYVDAEL